MTPARSAVEENGAKPWTGTSRSVCFTYEPGPTPSGVVKDVKPVVRGARPVIAPLMPSNCWVRQGRQNTPLAARDPLRVGTGKESTGLPTRRVNTFRGDALRLFAR